jgi:hypothetical protein
MKRLLFVLTILSSPVVFGASAAEAGCCLEGCREERIACREERREERIEERRRKFDELRNCREERRQSRICRT